MKIFFIICVALLFGSAPVKAGDLREYFPSDTGRNWSYKNEKHSIISASGESRKSQKIGHIYEQALGLSALSTSDRPVTVFRRMVREKNSTMGEVTISTNLHIIYTAGEVSVYAVDFESPEQPIQVFTSPQPLLLAGNLPGPLVQGAQGTLQLSTRLESQTVSKITVPAGVFPDCILSKTNGVVRGSLNGMPIKSGTIQVKSWYAHGIGLVT